MSTADSKTERDDKYDLYDIAVFVFYCFDKIESFNYTLAIKDGGQFSQHVLL